MTPARLRLGIIIGFVLAIELACRTGLVSHFVLTAPSVALWELTKIVSTGKYARDVMSTLTAWGIAVGLAMVSGVGAGIWLHARPVRKTLDPFLTVVNAVPTYVFYPLLVLIFGLGIISKMIIGWQCAVMVVILNTLHGLDRVPSVLLKTAQTYRYTPLRTLIAVRLRYAAPWLFVGFRLAVAWSFVGIIGAEFIASAYGLGHEIAFAYNNFDNPTMYALILFVLLFALTVNLLLDSVSNRLFRRA